MSFFGSFRDGGLFDGVADSFRDALKTFTLFPEEESAEVVINNELHAIDQKLKRIMDNVNKPSSIPQKKKNGQRQG